MKKAAKSPGTALSIPEFDRLSLSRWQPTPPINATSNAVQIFDEKHGYKDIKVDYPHFLLLCKTIKELPRLAPFIITLSITADSAADSNDATDYRGEDEEIVFNFFKLTTSLFKIYHIRGYPRLQLRMFSSKYTSQCYKALNLLRIHYPQDDSNKALLRYLYYIPGLDRLLIEIVSDKGGIFDERDMNRFKKANSLAKKRANGPSGCSHSSITSVEYQGTALPVGLIIPLKYSNRLSRIILAIEAPFLPETFLSAIVNPSALKSISIIALGHRGTPTAIEEIMPFSNLEDLETHGQSINEEFIDGLAKLKEFRELELLCICPEFTDLVLLLHTTSLRKLDIEVPASVQVGRDRRAFGNWYREGGREGGMRKGSLRWFPDWSAERAQKILELVEMKRIEVSIIDMWDAAILMSREADDERAR